MVREKLMLYLLFPRAFQIDINKICDKISSIDGEVVELTPILQLDGAENLEYMIQIGTESIRLVGVDAPIPKEIAHYTIDCTYGTPKELKDIRNHRYHMTALYEGTSNDINVVFNAYAKLAYGFLEQGLVGMVNRYSWNILTPLLIHGMVENEEAKKFASAPEMMVWRNFVKIPYNEGVWFVTKGNHLYDTYEYAYYASFDESQEVYSMFEDIFYHVYDNKAEIAAGHVMQLNEGLCIRFKEVYELEEVLQEDKKGTLVIEKLSK